MQSAVLTTRGSRTIVIFNTIAINAFQASGYQVYSWLLAQMHQRVLKK